MSVIVGQVRVDKGKRARRRRVVIVVVVVGGGWGSWGQNPHFFCPVSQTRSPGEPELAHRVRSSFRWLLFDTDTIGSRGWAFDLMICKSLAGPAFGIYGSVWVKTLQQGFLLNHYSISCCHCDCSWNEVMTTAWWWRWLCALLAKMLHLWCFAPIDYHHCMKSESARSLHRQPRPPPSLFKVTSFSCKLGEMSPMMMVGIIMRMIYVVVLLARCVLPLLLFHKMVGKLRQ